MDKYHEKLHKKHELEQHEVKQVLDFLKRYGMLIGAGIVAATVVVLITKGAASHRMKVQSEAEQMLASAQTPEQIEQVVNNYEKTETAQVALLNLAKTHFNNGDTAAARAQYERFMKDYKKSDLLPQAQFGLAYCTEAEGNFDEAATQFDNFLKEHPESYLLAPATLSKARCIEQAGRLDEARIILEDFLANNADSQWASVAEGSLEQINQ